MRRCLTNQEFIDRSIEIHGLKYDYSLIDYINNRTKVKIVCLDHGTFEQIPFTHLDGTNCPKCGKKKIEKVEFVNFARKIHGDKYDYSMVGEIKNNKQKVKIICVEHGIFDQSFNNHVSKKSGCPSCINRNIKSNSEEFIEKARKIHGDKYDYSLVDYKSNKVKVSIVCPKHGIFEQEPASHLRLKCGCRKCRQSKGEIKIIEILESLKIDFIYAYRVDGFEFDFYLPPFNIMIEYDGEQHYRPIEYFGGEDKFIRQIHNDKIKNEYCHENNIRLIRISYLEFGKLNDEHLLYLISSNSASTAPLSSEPGFDSVVV